MLPTQTVENYLKTIYGAQTDRGPGDALVPMGHLASTLGVAPGTATTMVKALADSGLVHYEPYAGVRLTPAGEKLASLVLRRHRLIELFLVKVLDMNWSEVHDEAEQLEHAVSDRLIERIDAMLGRPTADPHGDPIPSAEGTVPEISDVDLVTAAVGEPVRVARVIDQDATFLRFVERHGLVPGSRLVVIERDPASDSVVISSDDGQTTTIGARAAAKILVRLERPPASF
ncbi:MAG TPA: metal-dependent transcriptional regulator [Vicinamibacterales bacterium]|nr:metal-dependent transcriptional regulator [Vicinamibacterales bacterium]